MFLCQWLIPTDPYCYQVYGQDNSVRFNSLETSRNNACKRKEQYHRLNQMAVYSKLTSLAVKTSFTSQTHHTHAAVRKWVELKPISSPRSRSGTVHGRGMEKSLTHLLEGENLGLLME